MSKEKQIKRVAFVINKVTLSGGAERVMCILASEFSKMGIETRIFTQQNAECGYSIDERVKIIPAKTGVKIPVIRNLVRNVKMRKLIKSFKPNVVISFLTGMNIQTILFTLGLKTKVIVSERIYPALVSQPYKFLSKILYPLANGFVFQTEEARACFKRKVNKKGTVIFNPIAEEIPCAEEPSKDKYIVTVGRITKQKNHELLIRAFNEFQKIYPEYSLKIYGQGLLREDLEKLVSELGLDNKVKFMGAVKGVTEHIKDASMFILPSNYEGMPNVLMEAMAMGLPCVSTNCLGGGAVALIKDGENGILTPRGDLDALVTAMKKIASDAEFAKKIGENAKKVREDFSVEKITKEWLSYAESLL